MTEKRKRGRPKKYIPPERIVEGICSQPDPDARFGSGNLIEFVHDTASDIKMLVNLLNKMKSNTLQIKFSPNSMKILALDHCKKVVTLADINVSEVIRYYCKDEYVISLNVSILHKIISTCPNDKMLRHLSIVYNEACLNTNIQILTIHNSGMRDCDRIDIMNIHPLPEWDTAIEYLNSLSSYPLKCNISNDDFRGAINKATKSSKGAVQFEKESQTSPLRMIQSNNNMTGCTEFPDTDVTSVHNGELVAVRCSTTYLRNLAKLRLSDSISLYMENDKPLITVQTKNILNVMIVIPFHYRNET